MLAAQGLNLAKFAGAYLPTKYTVVHTRSLSIQRVSPFPTHTHTHTERRVYVTVTVGNTRRKTKVHKSNEEDKNPPQWTEEEFVL